MLILDFLFIWIKDSDLDDDFFRAHYFENSEINKEKLVRMMSEVENIGIQRLIDTVSNFTDVYEYMFAYSGSYSLSQLEGRKPIVISVSKLLD